MDSYAYERKHLKISLAFVILLMIWGLVFNELTESNIVELDAGSYVISGIIGLITIYVSRLQERPESDTHPLGYAGFVPILNLVRNLMIILISIKAIGESIGDIVSGPPAPEHSILFLYAGVTLVLNVSCYTYMQHAAHRLNSSLLKTDALEWKIDTVSNISILGAFGLAYGLERFSYGLLSHYVDPVICIFFSVYMCIGPTKLFVENIQQLSVSSIDKKSQDVLIEKFKEVAPLFLVHKTHFTIFTVAGVLWVNFEIEKADSQKISIQELSEATDSWQKILNEINPKNKLSYSYQKSNTNIPLHAGNNWEQLKKKLGKDNG